MVACRRWLLRFVGEHRWTVSFALLIGVIVFLANTRRLPTQWLQSLPYGDKLGHFLLMGTFALAANVGARCRHWRFMGMDWLQGSVCVAALVTLEECSQHFADARTFDLRDLLADYLGIFLLGRLALLWVGKGQR